MTEVKELIEEKWERPDQKANLLNPMKSVDTCLWDTPPGVNTSLLCLECHVSLPLENSVTFKHPMYQRVDADLRKSYAMMAFAFHPVIALTLVSKALKTWVSSVEAKRVIWLCHWGTDSASRQALCSIPYNGKLLFGNTLDDTIK